MKQRLIKAIAMFVFIAGFIAFGASAQTTETLTNNDVVKLTKLGLAPATVIVKIENSNSNFNVSVDSLVALKKQGVDKAVINEMVNITSQPPGDGQNQYGQNDAQYQNGQGNAPYQNGQNTAPYPAGQSAAPTHAYNDAPKDKNDPKSWHSEGIYYYNKANTANLLVPIEASDISGTKTGGYGARVAQYYTYGFARDKREAMLDGAHSNMQINQDNPAFYFYFNADNISPNQFTLVRFIQKRDYRVMVTGSWNYYERTNGVDEKERVEFSYEKLADGIYKVYTKAPLKPGEYCFMYTGLAHTPFSNVVYDFGISPQ